jgi:hypothetical protein
LAGRKHRGKQFRHHITIIAERWDSHETRAGIICAARSLISTRTFASTWSVGAVGRSFAMARVLRDTATMGR